MPTHPLGGKACAAISLASGTRQLSLQKESRGLGPYQTPPPPWQLVARLPGEGWVASSRMIGLLATPWGGSLGPGMAWNPGEGLLVKSEPSGPKIEHVPGPLEITGSHDSGEAGLESGLGGRAGACLPRQFCLLGSAHCWGVCFGKLRRGLCLCTGKCQGEKNSPHVWPDRGCGLASLPLCPGLAAVSGPSVQP